MPREEAPRLSHVGLYVIDVPKMIDFYTKVLGFVVSDGPRTAASPSCSRNPSDHHQVVLVRGRTTDADGADGAAGLVQRRHARQRTARLPQGAGGRLQGHRPALSRQCLVGLFQRSRRQPHRDVLRYAVVRAAAAAASRSTSTSPRTSSTARPKRSAAPSPASSRSRSGAPRSAGRSRRSSNTPSRPKRRRISAAAGGLADQRSAWPDARGDGTRAGRCVLDAGDDVASTRLSFPDTGLRASGSRARALPARHIRTGCRASPSPTPKRASVCARTRASPAGSACAIS